MKLLPGDLVRVEKVLEVTPGGVFAVPLLQQNEGIFLGYGTLLVTDERVAVVMPLGTPEDGFNDPVSARPEHVIPMMGSPLYSGMARIAKRIAEEHSDPREMAVYLNTFADFIGIFATVARSVIWEKAEESRGAQP